jgi:hypothetical protein
MFSGHLVLHQINALIFAMTIEACALRDTKTHARVA